MDTSLANPQQWHWSGMRSLGWLETAIKFLAMAVAFVALAQTLPAAFGWPTGIPGTLRFVAAAAMTLLLVLAIYDRIADREVFAMAFLPLNIGAHAAYVYLIQAGPEHFAVWLYPALMLAGDLVKFAAIRVYDMHVREFGPRVLYFLTEVFLAGYAICLITTLILRG